MLQSTATQCAIALLYLTALLSCGATSAPSHLMGTSPGELDTALPAVSALTPASRRVQVLNRNPAASYGSTFIDHAGEVSTEEIACTLSSGEPGSTELSWTLYELQLGGHPPDNWQVELNLPAMDNGEPSVAYLAIANFATRRWEWRQASEPGTTALFPAGSQHLSSTDSTGNTFIAAATCRGAKATVLNVQAWSTTLPVGPGRPYAAIEDTLTFAEPGDTVLVYPRDGGAAYIQPHLFVTTPELAFRAADGGGQRVVLDGSGYDYSGVGSTPRAIFQFQPEASGCTIEGFAITGAHNASHNGAGVRINQANDVTIRDCEIYGNDMGIMSNGDGSLDTARNQRITGCEVYANGSFDNPGYNHNFYLGGTSAEVTGCHIHGALTGHNLKSRTRFIRISGCFIHDSANRELDLVDASGDTDYAGADAVVAGCIIHKDPECPGNRGVVHFGQDIGHGRSGTIWLVHNTIVTPFITGIVLLSTPDVAARFHGNIIWDGASGQQNQQLAAFQNGAEAGSVGGSHNWLAHGQTLPAGHNLDMETTHIAASGSNPPFIDALNPNPLVRDYHLASPAAHITDAGSGWASLGLPVGPGLNPLASFPEYAPPLGTTPRAVEQQPDCGAYEFIGE